MPPRSPDAAPQSNGDGAPAHLSSSSPETAREVPASSSTLPGPEDEAVPTPEHRYLGELGQAESDLERAAATLVVGEGGWPDHIGALAATLIVENTHRRWEALSPPAPRYALFHRRWLLTLRLLAEAMPLYRRAVGAQDEQLLRALGPSLDELFRRAGALVRAMVKDARDGAPSSDDHRAQRLGVPEGGAYRPRASRT